MASMNGGILAVSQAVSMRLLIVEDEEDLRRGLEQALREEGYAVDGAAEGTDALYKAETWDYDAIILDIMLPGLDGWEILQRLRRKKKTPVLLLTARDAVPDRVRGLDLGADDYLVKPFDLGELLARVRSLIRRAADAPSPVLVLGPVSINTAARTVAVEGTEIALTAREFALLEYLASRRGKVVSRTELYDHLFAEEDESYSNLLDVHVCNLRRKLGRDLIQTRRGHGYVID
jgi:two-component system, OmpR family, response regulator